MDEQKGIQKQGAKKYSSNRIFQTHKLAPLIPNPTPAATPLICRQLVQELGWIESDSRRINKLNEAADIIQLARFTCCY